MAVIGDSTFVHSGITSLIDIAYNRSNSMVIVLDNSITGMTGHQQNPTTGYNIKGEPAARGGFGGPVPRHRHPPCRRGGPLRPAGGDARGAQRGAGGRGALGDHQPPALRAAEIRQAQPAPFGGSRTSASAARPAWASAARPSATGTARPSSTAPSAWAAACASRCARKRQSAERRRFHNCDKNDIT